MVCAFWDYLSNSSLFHILKMWNITLFIENFSFHFGKYILFPIQYYLCYEVGIWPFNMYIINYYCNIYKIGNHFILICNAISILHKHQLLSILGPITTYLLKLYITS